MTDPAPEIVHLRAMLTWPDKAHMADTIRRRIFAIEHDIKFSNPFGDVDETLYRIGGRQ